MWTRQCLHPVVRLLREGDWNPHSHNYPQFPRDRGGLRVRVYAPISALRMIHTSDGLILRDEVN
jgi:hypothetical protein